MSVVASTPAALAAALGLQNALANSSKHDGEAEDGDDASDDDATDTDTDTDSGEGEGSGSELAD
jgi:hypothetical protein